MPEHVVAAIGDALNSRKSCLQDAKILILGVAYKRDIDDLRESPSLKLIEILQDRGAKVDYHDPYFPRLHKMRRHDFKLASIQMTPKNLSKYDAVVIATDHSCIDYGEVVRHSKMVIDTRNATREVHHDRHKITLC